ncbi:hypothetical protein LAZ67_3002751 [Cordylochernes scorpioides]|uniref:Uncharacterized protein n=1 Tax=Cordylochernes scorpioides TaxID=51811 RepID=A0ABY6KBD0_9ARAC|nr:hypothetical protein LAZ67_3002751 [Cordylochernes scorpioides]
MVVLSCPWSRSDRSMHPDHNTGQLRCHVRMDVLFWIDVCHIEGCKDKIHNISKYTKLKFSEEQTMKRLMKQTELIRLCFCFLEWEGRIGLDRFVGCLGDVLQNVLELETAIDGYVHQSRAGSELTPQALDFLTTGEMGLICTIIETSWKRNKLEYSLDAQAVRRSRRLQGLEPEENIAMVKQETQTKMGEYHFQPYRNPSIFTGERN